MEIPEYIEGRSALHLIFNLKKYNKFHIRNTKLEKITLKPHKSC